MDKPYVNFPAFGIFRNNDMWVLAWGYQAGKNAVDPRVEIRLTDEALRSLHSELQRVIAQGKTDNDEERFAIPLMHPPVMVTWESLLEIYSHVENRIRQLASGQPIRDSGTFQTGGPN